MHVCIVVTVKRKGLTEPVPSIPLPILTSPAPGALWESHYLVPLWAELKVEVEDPRVEMVCASQQSLLFSSP